MGAMHSLTFSVVDGSKPLWVSTAAHLFKTLVRPILEYGGAMYGPMCSDAALATLERVQVIFGRRVLHLQQCIPGEYIRRELGLESMKERVLIASLRFFGHLAGMPKERLAGHVFRNRCNDVDDNVKLRITLGLHRRDRRRQLEGTEVVPQTVEDRRHRHVVIAQVV